MTMFPATAADREFLFEVYAASRDAEMAMLDWDQTAKENFLRMQFKAQDHHYRSHYPGAQFLVIYDDGKPIGRLYLHETTQRTCVMDIALLPAWRGAGIGGELLTQVLETAAANGRTVMLHVEQYNPARRLYERLGFRTVSDDGVYLRMEWSNGADLSGAEMHSKQPVAQMPTKTTR
jgi:GNAT superfamily N-acetyltransferase